MAHTTISLSPLVHAPQCTHHSVHKGVHQYWPHLFWALSSRSKITWQICVAYRVLYLIDAVISSAHTEIKILQTLPPELPVNSSLTISIKKPAKTCIDGQATLLCMISVVKVTWRLDTRPALKAQRYLKQCFYNYPILITLPLWSVGMYGTSEQVSLLVA